jgi:hypothetical protein
MAITEHEHIFRQGAAEYATFGRHLEFDVPVEQFDNSKAVNYYAALWVSHLSDVHSMDEYAEMVEGLLKDDSAGIRFKREVRRLRRNRCQ